MNKIVSFLPPLIMSNARLCLLALLTWLASALAFSCVKDSCERRYRPQSFAPRGLTEGVKPVEYHLMIRPHLDTFKFDARLRLSFQADKPIDRLTLNAKGLKFDNPKIRYRRVGIVRTTVDDSYQTVTFKFNTSLPRGKRYDLVTSYQGIIREDTTGFYRSSYQENNQTKWLATTQFQLYDARKAFPCFDEPNFKARFTVSIDCPVNYTCRSNMNPKTTKNGIVTFHRTPPMSTYLLAFTVSQFQRIDHGNDSEFSVWGRPQAMGMGDYPYEVGKMLLKVFDEYTGLKYYAMDRNENRTMKMDLAAIPDFWAGAMENWGWVTFREEYLLYDPAETSTRYKIDIATTVAHEIAHMWFGNLVTCRSWSELWLNEGLATYFQTFITREVEPGMGLEEQFVIDHHQLTLFKDFKQNALPISNPRFYSSARKAASVLRMLEHWIGRNNLKNGLKIYLKKNSFGTVTTPDLVSALNAVATEDGITSQYNVSVKEMMESWVHQAGYPLIDVTINQSTGDMIINQTRYLRSSKPSNETFIFPVSYSTQYNRDNFNTVPKFIMKDRMHVINLGKNPGWVIFNNQQTGLYRVNYDQETWQLLIEELKHNRSDIHVYNRAQIIDDSFNFARDGLIPYETMFELLEFLELETEYSPWQAAFAGFTHLRSRFSHNEEVFDMLNHHTLRLMNTLINDLKQEQSNESDLRKLFRTDAMNLACYLKHDECISTSREKFKAFKENNTRIDPDHREFVYCNGLRYGNDEDFDFLWRRYPDENVISEKLTLLNSIGCSNRPHKIYEFLNHTVESPSGIRLQDLMRAVLNVMSKNPENLNTTYVFVQRNAGRIRNVYGTLNFQAMISSMISRMSDSQLQEFESYLNSTNDLIENEKAWTNESIKTTQKKRQCSNEKLDAIRSWLKKKYATVT